MTPDSPLGMGNLAKNFLNIPMVKQGIQKKIAEDPGNKTFLKVIDEASKNMTSLLCKPGEEATIFNATAPPYYPASNTAQAQIKGNDSISFKTTLQPQSYAGSKYLDILQKSNFIFGSGSRLCPTNDCKQEFIDAYYRMPTSESPSEHVVSGTLKIENKTTSTHDTIKYNVIEFFGNFHTIAIEEDRKTGNNVTIFSGDFDLARTTSGFANPEFTYSVSGTFDNVTKVLTFEGQRSTSS